MILDGFYIVEKFEDYGNLNFCYFGIVVVIYIVKMVFVFLQLYFVFNNVEVSNVCIYDNLVDRIMVFDLIDCFFKYGFSCKLDICK